MEKKTSALTKARSAIKKADRANSPSSIKKKYKSVQKPKGRG